MVVMVVGATFCSGQTTSEDSTESSYKDESPTPALRSSGRRTATYIPRRRFLTFPKRNKSPTENVIGKSPCPRGTRGTLCRKNLARAAQTCTSDSCEQCRQECSSLSPSVWPTCCRNHFLCCRDLAYACQQCNFPELTPFCTAAFKKCF